MRCFRLASALVCLATYAIGGEVESLAEIARLGHVTRARVTQIMDLLLLAPDIQEDILLLPPTADGRDPIAGRSLRHVLRRLSFKKQREAWASRDPCS